MLRCTAEITGIAAADIVHDFITMMLLDAPPGTSKKADLDVGSESESEMLLQVKDEL